MVVHGREISAFGRNFKPVGLVLWALFLVLWAVGGGRDACAPFALPLPTEEMASVVVATLGKEQTVAGDLIDESMLAGDASRPDPGTQVPEGFGFPDTGEGVASDGFDQGEDFERRFPFVRHPVGEILEEVGIENQFALAAHRSSPARSASSAAESDSP